jgi:chloramphenicol 3-O-phosphotransferase
VKAIPLSAVAARVAAAPPSLGSTRLVCIDGPAGAGKTSFADDLRHAFWAAPRWDVQVLRMDDFYEGWTGLNSQLLERIETQVLSPLREGRPGRYQRYDWNRRAFGEWHEVPSRAALILEGVGSGGLPFAGSTTLLVWVDAPPEIRLARGVRRDGEIMRDEWLRWMTREAEFAAANRTCDRADLHVDGNPVAPLPTESALLLQHKRVGST